MRIFTSQGYNRYGWMLDAMWNWHFDWRVANGIAPFHNLCGVSIRPEVLGALSGRWVFSYPTALEDMWFDSVVRHWFSVDLGWTLSSPGIDVLEDMRQQHEGYERAEDHNVRLRRFRWLRRLRLAAARAALRAQLRGNED